MFGYIVDGVTTEFYWFEGRLLGQKTGNERDYIKNMKNGAGEKIYFELTKGILKSSGFNLAMNWSR